MNAWERVLEDVVRRLRDHSRRIERLEVQESGGGGWFPFGAWDTLSYNIAGPALSPYAGTIARAGTIRSWHQRWYVVGTNDASNYYTVQVARFSDGAVLLSFNTASGAPNVWTLSTMTGLSVAIDPSHIALTVQCVKTGSPGNIHLPGPALFVE